MISQQRAAKEIFAKIAGGLGATKELWKYLDGPGARSCLAPWERSVTNSW